MGAILVPHLGYATEESTVLHWLKQVGEPVAAGEAVVEITTEKAVHVVVAPQAGTLLAAYAPAGAILPEGEPLAWVGAPGEEPPALKARLTGWEEEVAPRPPDLWQRFRPANGGPPDARGGETAAEPPADEAPPPATQAPERVSAAHRSVVRHQLRRVTAARMAHSWREAPKVDLFAEVDFTRVQAERAALKAKGHEAPSLNVYIAHAAARAFADLPHLNVYWGGEEAVPHEHINIGVAVALGDNLVTVSMKDVGAADRFEVQRRFKALIRKALQMNLRREELYASSLTVTNLGEYDVSAFCAVLNPPEVFILAVGALEERPVVREGAVAAAPMCTLCLSFDHRAVDGAPASRLLQRIKQHLEAEPGVGPPPLK